MAALQQWAGNTTPGLTWGHQSLWTSESLHELLIRCTFRDLWQDSTALVSNQARQHRCYRPGLLRRSAYRAQQAVPPCACVPNKLVLSSAHLFPFHFWLSQCSGTSCTVGQCISALLWRDVWGQHVECLSGNWCLGLWCQGRLWMIPLHQFGQMGNRRNQCGRGC